MARWRSRAFVVASWVAVVAWALFIFWMSARAGHNMSGGIIGAIRELVASVARLFVGPGGDPASVIGHFGEYLVFGALLANALSSHMPIRRAAVLAFVLASAYGISDELHQYFVPGRWCDVADWVVDTLAGGIGAGLCALALSRREQRAVGR